MGLIPHPIKNILSLHLEASHFCLEKSNMDTPSPPPAERQSLSAERIPFAQRGGLSCIPHLVVSRQAKPHTAFPCHGSRQAATSCMRDEDHPRACKFSLPLWIACLSFFSHVCSPAACARGDEEDPLLVLEPNPGFQQIEVSCCSLNTTMWLESVHSCTCFIILRGVPGALAYSKWKPRNSTVIHHSALYNC